MARIFPVSIQRASYSHINIESLLAPLGGISRFVKKGDRVLLKWPDAIEYPLLSPSDVYNNGFALPNTADHLIIGKKLSQKQPVITDRCVGCGECETICPKEAIRIKNKMADVIRTRCICCYCCHEVCPEDAILLENIKH